MAENEAQSSSEPSNSKPPPPSLSARRPTITPPPRSSFEAFLGGGGGGQGGPGFSPGPMTLVSSFFSDGGDDDCKSFSQLLAGAITSPPPARLAEFWLPSPGPFGMSHQQVLAQVTAQATQSNSNTLRSETEYLSSLSSASPGASLAQLQAFSPNSASQQEMPPLVPASGGIVAEELSHQDLNSRSSLNVDKPNDDGYNWRKYGQKQVKGSEFPRSYYKCTSLNCPVKKKVERSLDGQVTEIIYKGQHNHQPPQSNKRGKDVGNSNWNSNSNTYNRTNHDLASQVQSGYFNKSKDIQESSQATHEQVSGTSDSEEVGEAEGVEEEKGNGDEPEPKRRIVEVAYSHRAVTEPRIIVQTTSEVDLLDDGYRWRKYGQKVVKGNPYPRSYYKCTTTGCNVRKHVERASSDPKAVITTYEGKHNHDVPAAKNSSHNTTANNNTTLSNKMELRNNNQQPIERLRFKEEQIT